MRELIFLGGVELVFGVEGCHNCLERIILNLVSN
jgi:hypothetical protein